MLSNLSPLAVIGSIPNVARPRELNQRVEHLVEDRDEHGEMLVV